MAISSSITLFCGQCDAHRLSSPHDDPYLLAPYLPNKFHATNQEGLWLGIMIYNPQNGLGLLVTSVDPEGQAGTRGVKLGDRMVELNGKKIP